MLKPFSPFTPGNPVGLDLFAGRRQQIETATRYLDEAVSGRQQNVFLIGDRGIGKSSFASVLREGASSKQEMVAVHVYLGNVLTIEELTRRVLEELVSSAGGETWYERVFERYKPYIQQVGVLGLKVSFHPPHEDLSRMSRRFPQVLGELIANLSGQRKGIVVILDDINGLADTSEFARWYKSVVDEIATHFPSYPALIMLSGTPDRRDQLARHEPSLLRVFRLIELERLSDEEVRDFFQRAFDQVDMEVAEDAMYSMVHYASGLPIMMHEIGDAAFVADDDFHISLSDATRGILGAAYSVGRRYLEPSVFRALQSQRYRSIVQKMGESIMPVFTRREIMTDLDDDERRVFDNLLRRLRELEVVEMDPDEGRGAYRYTNQIYPVYLYMQSHSENI